MRREVKGTNFTLAHILAVTSICVFAYYLYNSKKRLLHKNLHISNPCNRKALVLPKQWENCTCFVILQLLNKECLLHNYSRRNTSVDQINELINFYLVLTRCQESCAPRFSPALRLLTSPDGLCSSCFRSHLTHQQSPKQLLLNHRASCPLDLCSWMAHCLPSSTCPNQTHWLPQTWFISFTSCLTATLQPLLREFEISLMAVTFCSVLSALLLEQ